uniref:Small ribosomal subunit protein uS3m n=2 Tax=Chlorella clade TaxID=2511126 RepID=U5U833_9CHLO|nr:30S ribosomal protein S3 [Micractinium variabile]AGZ19411.1 30S ribosomal protein S3 [Chlorella sp. ArM0029B]QTK15934.1 30S ribosomal protein S3 [Micractinium variabile]
MGQKINPVSLRLHYTNRNFDNCWYSNSFYKNLINKDIYLQQYLNNFLKLLKLPTGRYSIQHLQKKTQVYNFICYSKSTRKWRSKLFGLAQKKNFLKKTRYFFKNKIELKKKRKKQTKFYYFYKTLNQLAVHKIQKKITSFQNFQLWSRLQRNLYHKKSFLLPNNLSTQNFFNLSAYLASKSFFDTPLNNLINQTNFCQQSFSIQKQNQSISKQKTIKRSNSSSELSLFNRSFKTSFAQLTNQNELAPDLSKLLILNKQKQYRSFLEKKEPRSLSNIKVFSFEKKEEQHSFMEIKDNSSLLFLQNLFVYKKLKSYLNKKKKITVSSKFFFDLDRTGRSENKKVIFNALDFKYKNYLESSLSSLYNLELNLIPFKVKNDWQHANYLADEIVYFLEKRIPFRRLKNKILKQLAKISSIRGVRVTCSGRVGGKSKKAQRAKTECFKYGQTSLHVFSSKIDFSNKTAFTSFGSVGVKVWICYN